MLFSKRKKIQQFPVKYGISRACSKLLLVSHGQQWSNNLSKTRKKKNSVRGIWQGTTNSAWMIQCFSLSSGITAATAQTISPNSILFFILFDFFYVLKIIFKCFWIILIYWY
jgi:hypothetical protein